MDGRVIYSTKLSGEVIAPGLEKYTNLAFKIASVCSSSTIISGVKKSDSFYETQAVINDLGGKITESNGNYKVDPVENSEDGFLALFNNELTAIKEYCDNEEFFHDGDLYFSEKISDESLVAVLMGIVFYSHKADISLDFLPDDTEYIDLALGLIGRFGGVVETSDYKVYTCNSVNKLIGGGTILLEGDWNVVAFGLMCGAIGNKINVKGAGGAFSVQRGAQILSPLKRMGYNLEKSIDGTLRMTLEGDAFSTRIDALECPDFLPYLILAAAVGNGNTEIYNINDQLTDEQSDRIVNTVAEFAKLGVKFIETGDGSFKVSGAAAFDGGVKLDCHQDYIVATCLIMATLCCKKSNSIVGFDRIEEIYPDFWENFKSIGGFTEIIAQ